MKTVLVSAPLTFTCTYLAVVFHSEFTVSWALVIMGTSAIVLLLRYIACNHRISLLQALASFLSISCAILLVYFQYDMLQMPLGAKDDEEENQLRQFLWMFLPDVAIVFLGSFSVMSMIWIKQDYYESVPFKDQIVMNLKVLFLVGACFEVYRIVSEDLQVFELFGALLMAVMDKGRQRETVIHVSLLAGIAITACLILMCNLLDKPTFSAK